MRTLPAGLTNLLKSGYAETHSWLILTTPGTNDPPLTYHLATASITIDGVPYQPSLRTTGAVKLSLTKAADRVDVEVENASEIFGPQFLRDRDKITGASIAFGRYWQDLDNSGNTYSKQLLTGAVSGVRVTRDAIQLTLVSDMYSTGSIGGNRLVGRRCQWTFRDANTCAYTGAELTCNKRYTDADGCSGRSNTFRFGGFIYIDPAASVTTGAGLSGPPANQLVKSTTGDSFLQRQFLSFTPEFGITDDAVNEQTEITITGWYNVKAYGATGDGSTNDTTAVQAAIDAAEAAGGGTVYFPPGTYKVTGLTVVGRVRLVGAGEGASVIYSVSNAVIVDMSGDGSSRGGEVHSLTIRGDVTAGSSQIGLKLDDGTYAYRFLVRDVRIESCGDHGLAVYKAFSSRFENIFITDCADYPVLYDAASQPGNVFISVYVGDVRAGANVAFRIKAGEFVGYNLNGINGGGGLSGSTFFRVGKKNGVDGDATNAGARLSLYDCNLESWDAYGIHLYHASQLEVRGRTSFAGNGTPTQIGIYWEHINDGSDYYAQFIPRGIIEDTVNFADGPSAYANSQPIHCNGFLPLMLNGMGPQTGGNAQLTTYRNTSDSSNQKMQRADARYQRTSITSTTTIPQPAGGYYEVNSTGGAITLTLEWSGWHERGQNVVYIKDVGGAAATNNITIDGGSGGTVNGSTYVMNKNGQAVILMPEGNSAGSGDWYVLADYVPGLGTGDVTGPGSSTDNAIARFDGTGGKTIQNSAVTIDDSGNISTSGNITGNNLNADGYLLGDDVYLQAYSSSASGASTVFWRRHRGSAGSPTAVQTNDVLGYGLFYGQYDSTDGHRQAGAGITVSATENWTSTNNGSRVAITASPNGSADAFAKGVAIDPTNISVEPTSDASMDLGRSSVQWRDLRLSRDTHIGRLIVSHGSAPTIAAGTGAGTSPTINVFDTTFACSVTLTTGSGPATSAKIFDLTMPANAPTYYQAWIQPANEAAAALSGAKLPYVRDASAAVNKVTIFSGTTALDASTDYIWYIFIVAV